MTTPRTAHEPDSYPLSEIAHLKFGCSMSAWVVAQADAPIGPGTRTLLFALNATIPRGLTIIGAFHYVQKAVLTDNYGALEASFADYSEVAS